MCLEIENALETGEQLDALTTHSSNLRAMSKNFQKQTRGVRQHFSTQKKDNVLRMLSGRFFDSF